MSPTPQSERLDRIQAFCNDLSEVLGDYHRMTYRINRLQEVVVALLQNAAPGAKLSGKGYSGVLVLSHPHPAIDRALENLNEPDRDAIAERIGLKT